MSRSICAGLVDETNSITVATLSLEVENIIGNSLQRSINGTYPAIDPVESIHFNNNRTILLVSPKIRAPFRKLVDMVFPNITVLSLNEIPSDVQIKAQGIVNI